MSRPFGIPTNAPNLPPGESEMVSKAQPMSEQNEGRAISTAWLNELDDLCTGDTLTLEQAEAILKAKIELLDTRAELQALRASSRG